MADEEAMLAKVQASWAQTAARDKARYADERVPERCSLGDGISVRTVG